MTDYTNAPATAMLATHCSACGRPLLDAESVTAMMGPVCRSKYALPDTLDEETRKRANALIFTCAKQGVTPEEWQAAVVELALIGCDAIAKRIGERFGAVTCVAAARPCKIGDDWGVRVADGAVVNPGEFVAVYARSGKRWVTRLDVDQGQGRWTTQRCRAPFPPNAPTLPAEPEQAPAPAKPASPCWAGRPTKVSGGWGVALSGPGIFDAKKGDRVRITARNGKTWTAVLAETPWRNRWNDLVAATARA